MAYVKTGTHKLKRALTFKYWRRHVSGKEKLQAKIMRKKSGISMNYKLLLADLDGTLAPNLGMPPQKFRPSSYLFQTIKEAQKYILFSLCTGRDKKTVMDVVNRLQLKSPQIIEGGAKIISYSGKTLWVKFILKNSAQIILKVLKKSKTSFSIIVDGVEIVDTIPTGDFDKITAILWYDLKKKDAEDIKKDIFNFKDINIAVNQDRTGNTLYITHSEGTKSHGVKKLMEMLGIKKGQVIGIGDGNNDIPLLLNCGFKVAMGNAVQKLKDIADYIAPDVDHDGVADVINKFI